MTRSRRVTAFPHQIEGTDFIASRPATALFDEQGLGKTKQLIDAVAREVEAGTLAGALIVCPNTLKSTWAREIERHSTLLHGINVRSQNTQSALDLLAVVRQVVYNSKRIGERRLNVAIRG